jgi:hypothetical protein
MIFAELRYILLTLNCQTTTTMQPSLFSYNDNFGTLVPVNKELVFPLETNLATLANWVKDLGEKLGNRINHQPSDEPGNTLLHGKENHGITQTTTLAKRGTSSSATQKPRVFINAAPPDMPLAKQLEKLLGTTFNYSSPIDFSKEPSEIRESLEHNLKSCDVVIILYGHTSYPWLQAQLSYCRRILADRDQPLKVVVCNLPSPTKSPLGPIISNVRILEGSTLEACLPSIKEILTNG